MDLIDQTSIRANLVATYMELPSSRAGSPASPMLRQQGMPLLSLPCLETEDRQLDDSEGMGRRRYTPLNLGNLGTPTELGSLRRNGGVGLEAR
mmetsp:Transcript_88204/g.227428  ORF Transcript_88204/g.227428 Transcript_88204/m.227428 type:complete len:93 (-) Transcript_88204:150-428(-)